MQNYNPFGINSQNKEHRSEPTQGAVHNNVFDSKQSSPFAETPDGSIGTPTLRQDASQAARDSVPYGTKQGQFPQFQDHSTADEWQKAIDSTKGASAEVKSGLDELAKKIEAAKDNGWGNQLGKFLALNRKRVAILAVTALFVFGGVQAYNNRNNLDIPGINLAAISEKFASNDNNTGGANQIVSELDLILEDVEPTNGSGSFITKTAGAGDGITHLARYAIQDYLKRSGESLSAEQKIYAEDYVQNRIGSEPLEIGEKLSFSNDLLDEAVSAAESLEDWQIENLSQYTANTSLL